MKAVRSIGDEIDCWEQRLSAYRSDSELRRWIDGRIGDTDLSPELCSVLARAKHWELVTERRLNPVRHPDGSSAAFDVSPTGRVRTAGDLSGLRLDAFAKGFIVDRAVERVASRPGMIDVMASVGGDLRAVGPVGVTVGIEHPGRPFDNEPPVHLVTVCNGALAVSGRSRRGDHLVDGRTNRPIAFNGSYVVSASTLETADGWATSLCVDPDFAPDDGIEWSRIGINGDVATSSASALSTASAGRRSLA